MTINELKKLLTYNNIHLGLHGHNHLDLKNTSKIESMTLFKYDLEQSLTFMKQNTLITDIFIYPYDYIVLGSETILKNKGFKYIFPSKNNKRVYIEELL
jgi:predicted deacetylase